MRVRSPSAGIQKRLPFPSLALVSIGLASGCATPVDPVEWPDLDAMSQSPLLPEEGTVEHYEARVRGVHAVSAELRFLASDNPTTLLTQLHFETINLFALMFPLSETITLECDRITLRPRWANVESRTRNDHQQHTLQFDDRVGAVAMLRDEPEDEHRITLYGVEPWEPVSLALRLRDLDTLDDFEESFQLLLGARLHQISVKAVGQETIGDDEVPTWHLHGEIGVVASNETSPPSQFDAWVGTSPNRPVVRFEVASPIGPLVIERVGSTSSNGTATHSSVRSK